MDISKFVKRILRCCTMIKPDRYATVVNKVTIMSIENDHDMNHWFQTNAHPQNVAVSG